jgi:DNA polymerase I
MKPRVLLIDADVFAYEAASFVEVETHWGDGYYTWHTDAEEVKRVFMRKVEEVNDTLKASKTILCLSDPDANWRKSVYPQYKSHRAGVKKPLALRAVKSWLMEEHDAQMLPSMEGDDLLGILATSPNYMAQAEKIVVSLDKDLKTIPGTYCRRPLEGGGFPEIEKITKRQADDWHLIQTLAGDPTDGYPGCPGIGMVKAQRFVTERVGVQVFQHEMKRGPRKGQVEVRFEEVPMDDPWQVVVSHFEAAGLTEADALVQARVARICRATDYNPQTKEPILWTPPTRKGKDA